MIVLEHFHMLSVLFFSTSAQLTTPLENGYNVSYSLIFMTIWLLPKFIVFKSVLFPLLSLLKYINRFLKQAVCWWRICSRTGRSSKPTSVYPGAIKCLWICRPNSPMNPHISGICCILDVLYYLCNMLNVLPSINFLLCSRVNPLSVNNIQWNLNICWIVPALTQPCEAILYFWLNCAFALCICTSYVNLKYF